MRNYGFGNASLKGTPPRFRRLMTEPIEGGHAECPNCGCQTLCEIEVDVDKSPDHPVNKVMGALVGPGLGVYLGCPACPWASPMIIGPKSILEENLSKGAANAQD